MMHETLLRVLMVSLGLLMCPREDPGVQDWEETMATGLRTHEERLQKEEAGQETAPVREETTSTDTAERHHDEGRTLQEHNESDGDKSSDAAVDFMAELEPNNETETGRKTSPREEENEVIQTDVFVAESDGRETSSERSRSFIFTAETAERPEWEDDFLWYIWNTFSIISMIRFLRRYLRGTPGPGDHTNTKASVAGVRLPDVNTLQLFHTKCVEVSSRLKWEGDFLEGFVSELLEAMRGICGTGGGLGIQDFQMVNRRDVVVPVTLPEPFEFQFELLNHQDSDSAHMELCGQIKVLESKTLQTGCPCQTSDVDDMVCLLHGDHQKVRTTRRSEACGGPFCAERTPFLSRSLVSRWFQSAVQQAWALVSHKYEFEVGARHGDAPGSLTVRFRSGKKISFNLRPVVQHGGAHFVLTPRSWNDSDTLWTLSLTNCEDRLLRRLSKRLPADSCHLRILETALFLHRKQKSLSGEVGALKERHFRMALLHLLLTTDPSLWGPGEASARLRDLLVFMETSIRTRLLKHVLVGNPLSGVSDLPAELAAAQPLNLFHPLVVHDCMYRNAATHFQEMLRNAHMLIHDCAMSEPTGRL